VTDYVEITTSPEVYHVIFARHGERLKAFETFSDPDGTFHGGPGERGCMVTVWGFDGCDWPILKAQTVWDIDPEQPHKRLNEERHYWLCLPRRDDS
jgi:hypothetical protein